MRRVIPVLLLSIPLSLATPPGPATAQQTVVLSAGIFDTAAWFDDKGDFDALEGGVAIHGATAGWGLVPIGGVAANDDGAFWLHIGAGRPFGLGRGWSLTPSLAAAYYDQGDSKDLGNELEFRSALALSRRGANGHAVGVEYYHLSNASISDVNPGSNSFVVTYAIPLAR